MEKEELLKSLKEIFLKYNLSVSSAESCTGGLISSYLTDIAGSSQFIFQNFVTYSNDAKIKFLNVKKGTLEKFGAVSEQTAYEMGMGLKPYSDVSVTTTGILGPSGGTKEKPIGLCYISLRYKDTIEVIKYISKKAPGNIRYEIKKDIVEFALFELLLFLKNVLK